MNMKAPVALSRLIPLLTLCLALLFALPATDAGAAPKSSKPKPFRCEYFTIDLPKRWALVNGPFKKNNGETAVLGRRDRNASVQLIYGPIHKENFRAIVEGYGKNLKAKPIYGPANQAWFDATRQGTKFRFVFRADDRGEVLVIFILNGNPADMEFIYTGMKSSRPGLVPVNPERKAGKAKKGK